MNFQDLWNKFSLIFGQLCAKKTCAFVMMGNWKKGCVGWWYDRQRSLGRQGPFSCCACVFGAEGGLSRYNKASNAALATKYW